MYLLEELSCRVINVGIFTSEISIEELEDKELGVY